MTKGRVIALCLVLGAITGCGRSAPVPTDTFYRLSPPGVAAAGNQLTRGSLYVETIDADSLYRERALLYSEDPGNLTLKQYHYHHWEESPPRMLRQQLVGFLRAAGAAPNVTSERDTTEPALRVRGRLLRFEHLLGGEQVVARVALEMQMLAADGKVLLLREYRIDRPAASNDVAAVVAAMDEAVTEIFTRFLSDALGAANPAAGT